MDGMKRWMEMHSILRSDKNAFRLKTNNSNLPNIILAVRILSFASILDNIAITKYHGISFPPFVH